MAAPDPFTAAFGTPAAAPTPATASPSPADAFEAAFGPLRPSSKTSAPVASLKTGEDLGAGNAFAGGLIEGLPIVGPGLKSGIDAGIAHLRSWTSGKSVDEERANLEAMKASTLEKHPTATGAGEITGNVAGYGLAAAAAPAAFGIGAASLPVAAFRSGITNALLSGADAYSRGEDPTRAAEIGGTLGTFAPIIGSTVSHLFTNYIQPEVARLANLAINKFNIPLGPDLISTNPMLRFASSVMERMPFSGGQAAKEARLAAFNRAIAHEAGVDADAFTPDVMRKIRSETGQIFNSVSARTPTVAGDTPFTNDLTRIWTNIQNPHADPLTEAETKILAKQIRNITDVFNKGGGSITGQQYQQLTRKGTMLDDALNAKNPNIRQYTIQLKGALDGALERSAPADAVADLAQARKQWWVMKTVEDLASKSPTGRISPALLKAKVDAHTNDMAYGGGGDMAELARIGDLFLKEAGSSGTSERELIMEGIKNFFSKFGSEAAAVGAMSYIFHHPVAAIAGLAIPAVIGRGAAAVARSPRIGNSLVRMATGTPGPVARGARAIGRKVPPRYLLPGLVQQAQPIAGSYLPDNRRGR